MIVVCGNTKGGIGKTTLATQIALARQIAGRAVPLIDAARQGLAQSRNDACGGRPGGAFRMRAPAGRKAATGAARPRAVDVWALADVADLINRAQEPGRTMAAAASRCGRC